jgi:ribonuclease PH
MPFRVRPIRVERPYLRHAEGSCLFRMGETRVLCVASVEDRVPPHAEAKGTGWVTGEYGMLPRAGDKRTPRSRAQGGGRAQEISRLLGRSLRAVVDLAKLGPRTITVDCDVLQADGGTRTASINGGFIALADALRKLHAQGALPEWPLKDYVAAVSVGSRGGQVVLDMSFEDDVDADVDLNVVMTGSGKFVEIQGTAEGEPFGSPQLERLLRAARAGVRQVLAVQRRLIPSVSAPARPRRPRPST